MSGGPVGRTDARKGRGGGSRMVADGGISPFTFVEILQDQAGEQTPSQTRVSLGQAGRSKL